MRGLKKYLCLVAALLAACVRTATPVPATASAVPATALASAPAPATSATETAPSVTTLRVWLPPEFAPDVSTASGRVLSDQISAFEDAHAGTAIDVRIKAVSGPGGLLSSLMTAANVAPSGLPNLVALRRDDLTAAAAAALVTPLDRAISADLLADHYPFAQAMGRYNGAWVGLPFAADARVLAYLTSIYTSPPLTWNQVTTGTLILPAAEGTSLTVLNVYQGLGGSLSAPDGKPNIDPALLAQALEIFHTLQIAGRLPPSTLDYADPAVTWEAFRQGRATLAVTSATSYLAENFRVDGAAATLLPTRGGAPLALAGGWSWAIVNVNPEHFALCAELLAWLSEPARHAAWTEAALVLPTRGATLEAWQSARLVPFVSDVVTHAQLEPPAATLGLVGPPLRQALGDVLNGRATAFAAATLASQSIQQP